MTKDNIKNKLNKIRLLSSSGSYYDDKLAKIEAKGYTEIIKSRLTQLGGDVEIND